MTRSPAMSVDPEDLIELVGRNARPAAIDELLRSLDIPRGQRRRIIGDYVMATAASPGPKLGVGRELSAFPANAPSPVGHRCRYCGDPATTMDHAWPRSRGGDDHPYNLVPACSPCNGRKGQRSLLTSACTGCGTAREPGDVDTRTGTAYYTCRCGSSWTKAWDLQHLLLT